MTGNGLPHSEIPGSKRICRFPRLIAAYHVLHRLLMPRHPSCALTYLTKKWSTQHYACHIHKNVTGMKLHARLYVVVKEQTPTSSGKTEIRISKLETRTPKLAFESPLRDSNFVLRISTSPSWWWAWLVSNQRPQPYQGCALTN